MWIGAGIIGVMLLGLLGLLLLRRHRTNTAAEPEIAPAIAIAPMIAAAPIPDMPSLLRIRLTVIGPGPGTHYDLDIRERLVIGRHPNCDLSFSSDKQLSGTHCALLRQGERLLVEDLGSTHGTLVNGVPIHERYPIEDGDRLMLGRTELRISLR